MRDEVKEMGEKKSIRSWTISDEFWEEIKDEVPETKRDAQKHYVHALGQGRKRMPARKALEGISMCCERAVNGRHCHGSTAAAARYTERFKNGWQRDFLRKSGPKVWKSMMKWEGSAGRGKAWMAVW